MNLVFMLMDAVRADHMGYHGHHYETTPFIDDLAEESLVAMNCYSQGNATEQEMSTMLTGLYPEQHGIVGQDHPRDLSEEVPTFMEALQQAGYNTYTVSYTSKAVRRGSDEWVRIRDADEIIDSAVEYVKDIEEPYAVFLHFMQAHSPYAAKEEYMGDFYVGNPTKISTLNKSDLGPTATPDPVEKEVGSGIDPQFLSAKYDAAIRWLDDTAKRIHKEFIDGEDTALFITADHGESLTLHDIYFEHRGLYEPCVHVPLLINAPNLDSNIIENYVEHVDYFATIFDLLDIQPPETSGHSILDGSNRDKAYFCENTWNSARGVIADNIKYIKYYGTKVHGNTDVDKELYNLSSDPDELCNIAWRTKNLREQMDTLIENFVNVVCADGYDPIEEEDTTLPDNHPDEEVRERLEGLGYID